MVEESVLAHADGKLKRTIGLVGTGRFGQAVARVLVANGHTVRAANSRGPQTLSDFAKSTGALPVPIAEVGDKANFLILALPLGKASKISASVFAALSEDAIVIDASNYVPYNDGIIAEIEQGKAESAWLSSQLGGIPIVKAFNTIFDYSLENFGSPAGTKNRIALPVSGDDEKKRASVMGLIEGLGFDAYDAGLLNDSWRQQIGQTSWCADPTKSELRTLLQRAELKTVKPKRDTSMKMAKKVPADFPRQDLVRVSRLMAGLDLAKLRSYFALLRLLVAMLLSGNK